MLDAWSETQLRDICYHWDTAYDISVIDGVWTARFLGPSVGELLQAGHPDLLRQMIRSDYGKRKETERSGKASQTA